MGAYAYICAIKKSKTNRSAERSIFDTAAPQSIIYCVRFFAAVSCANVQRSNFIYSFNELIKNIQLEAEMNIS